MIPYVPTARNPRDYDWDSGRPFRDMSDAEIEQRIQVNRDMEVKYGKLPHDGKILKFLLSEKEIRETENQARLDVDRHRNFAPEPIFEDPKKLAKPQNQVCEVGVSNDGDGQRLKEHIVAFVKTISKDPKREELYRALRKVLFIMEGKQSRKRGGGIRIIPCLESDLPKSDVKESAQRVKGGFEM